jgi:predicted DNA-binding transcriptional regulator AlpA
MHKCSNDLPTEGFVRFHQSLKIFPVSRSGWWAGVRNGRFPESVKISPGVTVWRSADIASLIEKISKGESNHE